VITTETGAFSPATLGSETDFDQQQIEATAQLGTQNHDERFLRQRQAVRSVLTFVAPSNWRGDSTWHGPLPCRINADLPRWQGLIDVAASGGDVRLHPDLATSGRGPQPPSPPTRPDPRANPKPGL
jgi:hypothetical protein